MKTNLHFVILFIFLGLTYSCKKAPKESSIAEPYPIHHVTKSQNAMVVSAHPLASDIGIEIMRQGGNAVDAAIAVQFALAVTYPRAGNIGGGGFMVIRDADGKNYTVDYREKAPAAASKEMYLDSLKNVIQDMSVTGHMAVGVPGTVHGLYSAWDSLGEINTFSTLLEPAIRIAAEGFRINSREAGRLNQYHDVFAQYHDDTSPFLRDEWAVGDTLIQSDLAGTLQRIADAEGPQGFYAGKTAFLFEEEMKKGGGIITKEDLENYRAAWRKPQIGYYKNNKIISMPPPSSGGVALLQLLEIVEQFDIDKMHHQSAAYIHLLAEAERRVYADRAEYLGDTDFVDVPRKKLLDSLYLKERMSNFNPTMATKSSALGAGDVEIKLESFETTHTSVVDKNGMAVSLTTTLNTNYGSKTIVNGAGFFLNNEMDDFSAKPGVPNVYGLIGNEANAIAPDKRMLSSMTPTIVERDGQLLLVVGTPGGSTIITSVFQVILNVIDHHMELKEAVFTPRFHHQWLPDKIFTEGDMWSTELRDSLAKMGYEFDTYDRIGLVKAIKVESDGSLTGVGDIRSDDHASGY
jgi:gamma-glutamyltranspeptidase/glutathione hydrolase